MQLTILYSCDNWHSQESKFLHGVFSDRFNALEAIEELAPGKLTAEQRDLLFSIGQTQGYAGDGEWMTETVTLDEISCRLD